MDKWDKREKELTEKILSFTVESNSKKTMTHLNFACNDCNDFVFDVLANDKKAVAEVGLNAYNHMVKNGHVVDRKEFEVGDPCGR